jgi:hypothetical protein
VPELNVVIEPPVQLHSTITPPSEIVTSIEAPTDGTLVLIQPKSLLSEIQVTTITTIFSVGQGPAGPAGPAGSGEEMAANDKEVDFVGTDVIYKGDAAPGSLHSAAVWRIKKLTFVGEDFSERYANGTSLYDKVWNNRASYTY